LTPAEDLPAQTLEQTAASAPARAAPRRRPSPIFALTVLLPTLLAALYFGLMASDVYIAESRFVVRNPQVNIR
jgi:capsule polysaccharide export protein KpsE/RkpR